MHVAHRRSAQRAVVLCVQRDGRRLKAAAAARGRRLLETPTVPLSVFTITKRCRVACNGARCAYDETSMHKAGKEAKGERKILG